MALATDKYGLFEGYEPTQLWAYDGRPEHCLRHTVEEYRRLYKMLDPKMYTYYEDPPVHSPEKTMQDHGQDSFVVYQKVQVLIPVLAQDLEDAEYDPEKVILSLIKHIESCSKWKIQYAFFKKAQSLILQVAPENLPLFIGFDWEMGESGDRTILYTILEWRLLSISGLAPAK